MAYCYKVLGISVINGDDESSTNTRIDSFSGRITYETTYDDGDCVLVFVEDDEGNKHRIMFGVGDYSNFYTFNDPDFQKYEIELVPKRETYAYLQENEDGAYLEIKDFADATEDEARDLIRKEYGIVNTNVVSCFGSVSWDDLYGNSSYVNESMSTDFNSDLFEPMKK